MVRPEGLVFAGDGAADAVPGRVADRRFAGAATFYRVETEDGTAVTVQGPPHEADPGDAVRLALHPRAAAIAYPPPEP